MTHDVTSTSWTDCDIVDDDITSASEYLPVYNTYVETAKIQ